VEISANGIMTVVGGYSTATADTIRSELNDVWASLDGGYSWGVCSEDAEFGDRRYPFTLIDAEQTLYVMGGREYTANPRTAHLTNDVWRSNFRFDDIDAVASLCHILKPACGKAGMQCIPGSYGFEQGMWGVQCEACSWSNAANGGNSGSGSASEANMPMLIALIVFVGLFVLTAIAFAYVWRGLSSQGINVSLLTPANVWSKAGSTGDNADSLLSSSTNPNEGQFAAVHNFATA